MRIVCFGDSVTRGISFAQGRLRILKENYPALLQKGFEALDVEVMNQGAFNNNSDDLIHRLDSDVIEKQPDYVLIEIGGNDCNFRWDEVAKNPEQQHEPIVPLARYISNVSSLIENIRAADATPILLNLPPLDPVRYYNHIASQYGSEISHWIACCGGIEHWHGMYNRSLKKIVEKLQVITVDVRTAFKQADSLFNLLSDDGIHPTARGYKIMSQVVLDTLRLRLF